MGDRSKSKEAGRPQSAKLLTRNLPNQFWNFLASPSKEFSPLAFTSCHLHVHLWSSLRPCLLLPRPHTHYTRPQYLGPDPTVDCRHSSPPFPYIWQKKKNSSMSHRNLDRSKRITHKAFKRMPWHTVSAKYCFKTCYSQGTLPQFPIN